ncbi:TPA: hypothetical protein PMB28_001882 [Vibrio cholerae]|nr:hypothetical protein [Vibrio cholerae]
MPIFINTHYFPNTQNISGEKQTGQQKSGGIKATKTGFILVSVANLSPL